MLKPISQRVWAVALAGVLAVGALGGCNAGPTTTEGVLQTYEQAQNRDNYHAVSTVTLASDDGDQIKVETVSDVAQDASHSTMTAHMFGLDTTSETYVEKSGDAYMSYQSVDVMGNTFWTKSQTTAVSNIGALTADDVLQGAEFAKTDEGYTLTVPAEKVFSALVGADTTYESLKELAGSGLADALASSTAVYTFDKNCLLTSISCPVTFEQTDDEGNVASVTTLSFDFTVSDYGTVAADALVIPADVTEKALDLDELQAGITEFGNSVADALGQFTEGLGDLANSLLEDGGVSADATATDGATEGAANTTDATVDNATEGAAEGTTETTGTDTTAQGEGAVA